MEILNSLTTEAVFSYIPGFICNTLEVWVQLSFAGLLLEKRNYGTPPKQSMYFILMFVFLIIDYISLKIMPVDIESLPFLFRAAVAMLLRSIFVFALYKAPFFSIKRLSAMTVLISILGISMLIEFIYGTVIAALGMDLGLHSFQFIPILFMRILMILLYLLARKVYVRHSYETIIHKTINFLFLLSFALYFFSAFWLSSRDGSYLWVLLTLFIIVASILVIRLFYESAAKKQEQEQAKLLSMKNKLMTERMESDKRLMDAVHQTRHDLHKHLDYVYSLLDESQTDEAKMYIQQITKPVKAETPPVRTGCPAMDTVLQIEQQKALAQGITMEIISHGVMEDCIAPKDCSCILGNLLDNAIEAQAEVAEDHRYIQVSLRQKHDFLMINIKNTVVKNPLQYNKKLQTTKTEQAHLHGIGLKSVEAAVRRYAGELSFDFREGLFSVSVLLCVSE